MRGLLSHTLAWLANGKYIYQHTDIVNMHKFWIVKINSDHKNRKLSVVLSERSTFNRTVNYLHTVRADEWRAYCQSNRHHPLHPSHHFVCRLHRDFILVFSSARSLGGFFSSFIHNFCSLNLWKAISIRFFRCTMNNDSDMCALCFSIFRPLLFENVRVCVPTHTHSWAFTESYHHRFFFVWMQKSCLGSYLSLSLLFSLLSLTLSLHISRTSFTAKSIFMRFALPM